MPLIVGLMMVLCVGCGSADPVRTISTPSTTRPSASSSPAASVTPEDAVKAAYAAYYDAYFNAIGAPKDSAKLAALLALYTPDTPARADMTERINGLARRSEAGRRGPAGYYVIERIDFRDSPEGRLATATVCSYDDGVIYDAVNRVNGQEIIVNDNVSGARGESDFLLIDGAWKLNGGEVLERWGAENQCPPR